MKCDKCNFKDMCMFYQEYIISKNRMNSFVSSMKGCKK